MAFGRLERLVRDGIAAGDRHYRVFGGRHGSHFSMSLGLPVLGGSAPVLRARLREGALPTTFEVSVGARLELVVLAAFWGLITLLGGGYQLFLQLREVAAGRAGWSAVTDVLPGIGVMLGILALGAWLFRWRAVREGELLLGAFRDALRAPDAGPAPVTAAPIH